MKYLFLSLSLVACINTFAQVKVTQGDNSPNFSVNKQTTFASFYTDKLNYFVIKHVEEFEKMNTLIVADKNGHIITDKEIRINRGVFNNPSSVKNLLVVNTTPVIFVENRNKAEGKNTLTVRAIDDNGNVSDNATTIGTTDFVKLTNAGEWYAALTPDKKHVAIIGKAPYEKGTVNQFSYFILDDKMQVTAKGQFSFAGKTENISVYDFLASDKGDFYIMSEDFDKSYKYPTLYKYTAGGAATIIPVMISDPGLKNLNYITKVNPDGDLIIAGYMQKKKSFSVGDPEATGTWLFNSSKINEVKTFNFDKPVSNVTARNIIYNGDVFYLVGEQFKADKETSHSGALASMSEPAVYDYTYGDIMVTGFTTDGNKKFEMALSRSWQAKDFDQDLTVASGTINNKLALVYNDQHGKYIDDKYYKNIKVPVAVLITNDGLMETPVQFAKELDVKISTYKLFPQYFINEPGRLMILSVNSQSVKTVTFQ